MKLFKQSNFTVFLYKCIAVELISQLILSLLPTSWRNELLEFVLRGFLLMVLALVMLASLSRISQEYKTQGFSSFIPFFLFAMRVICIPLMLQFLENVKFLVAQKMYNEIVYLVDHDSLKKEKPENTIIMPSSYWYIGGGQKYAIETIKSNDKNLIFFRESGFLDRSCGYLHSPNDTYPSGIGGGIEGSASLDFRRIFKNWFYGCITYEG